MASFSPLLTATPTAPPTYNVGMAETFSWVPIEGAGRPLYARATYLANPEDIKVSLSAGDISVGLDTTDLENLIARSNTLLDSLTSDTYSIEVLTDSIEAFADAIDLSVVNTNLRLDLLTAVDFSTSTKQSAIITLLNVLTANTDSLEINTDSVESLLSATNTKLDALTAKNTTVTVSSIETKLDALTAVEFATEAKQDSAITLLHQLTANTDSIESLLQTSNSLLDSISAKEMTISLDVSAINLNTDEIEGLIEASNTLLDALTAKVTITDVSGIETRLDVLTAVDYATEAKQDVSNTLLNQLTSIQNSTQSEIITLLHSITGSAIQVDLNTDQLELHVDDVETKLDAITGIDFATSTKQDSIITLLDALTAKQTTVNLDVSAINLNTDEIEGLIETSNTLLDALTAKDYTTSVAAIETRLDILTAVDYATEAKQDVSNTLLSDLTASNKYVPGFSIPPYNEISFEYVGTTDIFRKVTYLNNSTQVMALSFVYVTEPPTVGDAIIQSVKKI